MIVKVGSQGKVWRSSGGDGDVRRQAQLRGGAGRFCLVVRGAQGWFILGGEGAAVVGGGGGLGPGVGPGGGAELWAVGGGQASFTGRSGR